MPGDLDSAVRFLRRAGGLDSTTRLLRRIEGPRQHRPGLPPFLGGSRKHHADLPTQELCALSAPSKSHEAENGTLCVQDRPFCTTEISHPAPDRFFGIKTPGKHMHKEALKLYIEIMSYKTPSFTHNKALLGPLECSTRERMDRRGTPNRQPRTTRPDGGPESRNLATGPRRAARRRFVDGGTGSSLGTPAAPSSYEIALPVRESRAPLSSCVPRFQVAYA